MNSEFNIINLNDVATIYPNPEYIIVMELTSARVALKYLPNSKAIWLGLRNSDAAYNNFMNHIPELYEVYESLIDEESRKTFCGYWLGKTSGQIGEIVYANTTQYMLSGFMPKAGDVVIDCGACDGGTSVKFVNLGCKVYSFEMDKQTFELAKVRAKDHGFIVENLGLGSFKHKMNYYHNENDIGASKLDINGTDVTQIVKLDSYIFENKISHVDFIKMDTEGAELDILRGASTVIARDKPILALSAYHKLDDFWVLMNFIKSIRPDYEFAMRQYASNSEDLPFNYTEKEESMFYNLGLEPDGRNFAECVLFAR